MTADIKVRETNNKLIIKMNLHIMTIDDTDKKIYNSINNIFGHISLYIIFIHVS